MVKEHLIEGQKDHKCFMEPYPPQPTCFISPFIELTSPGLTVVVWVRHVHEYYSLQHLGITYLTLWGRLGHLSQIYVELTIL